MRAPSSSPVSVPCSLAGSITRRAVLAGAAGFAVGQASVGAREAPTAPPRAHRAPVTDQLWGRRIEDPYRWMESLEDPMMQDFLRGQDAYARAVLARLPGRRLVLNRLARLSGASVSLVRVVPAGGLLFIQLRPPGAVAMRLIARAPDTPDRVLFDAASFSTDIGGAGVGAAGLGGAGFGIDYWQPSPDGRRVVVGVSADGSEETTLLWIDVASGAVLPQRWDRCWLGAPCWAPDSESVFVRRWDRPAPRGATGPPRTAALWRIAPGAPDRLIYAPDAERDPGSAPGDMARLIAHGGASLAVLEIARGVKPERRIFTAALSDVLADRAVWRPIAGFEDLALQAQPWQDGVYLLSVRDAPRGRILRIGPDGKAVQAAATGDGVIAEIAPAREGLYLRLMEGGANRLEILSADNQRTVVKLPAEGRISGLETEASAPGAYFTLSSWTAAPRYLRVTGATATDAGITPHSIYDLDRFASVRVKARSPARPPVSLVFPKDMTRDGQRPLILTVYGAYGQSLEPAYVGRWGVFLEMGGILGFAHVRGGGEYGRAWHEAGRGNLKPNSWRDLIAIAETLIAQRWTHPSRLFVRGASAGAIAAGRAVMERPDLFAGAILDVGLVNTVRLEAAENGPRNTPEFGSVATRDGFEALLEMDVVHAVSRRRRYPPMLLTTGANDQRVPPWMPAKLAATLQAGAGGRHAALLRTRFDAGHGPLASPASLDADVADAIGFALWRMGHPAFAPAPA